MKLARTLCTPTREMHVLTVPSRPYRTTRGPLCIVTVFKYPQEINKAKSFVDKIVEQVSAPMYEVRQVAKPPYKGFYRIGKMADFEEKSEKYSQHLSELNANVDDDDDYGIIGTVLLWALLVLVLAFLAFMMVYLFIAVVCVFGPIYFLLKFLSILLYKIGMFPSRLLTSVDYLYVHEDGMVVVPMGNYLRPFEFEVEEDMKLIIHYHDDVLDGISLVRRSRQFFKLNIPRRIDAKAVTHFLDGFGLQTKTAHTKSGN